MSNGRTDWAAVERYQYRQNLSPSQRQARSRARFVASFVPVARGAQLGFRSLRGVRRLRTGKFGLRWMATRGPMKGKFIKPPRRTRDYIGPSHRVLSRGTRFIDDIMPFTRTRRLLTKSRRLSMLVKGDITGFALSKVPWYYRFPIATAIVVGKVTTGRSGSRAPTGRTNARTLPARIGARRAHTQPARGKSYCRRHRRYDWCKKRTR